MTYQFMEDHRSHFRVERMAAVLGVARSGYYAWRRRGSGARQHANTRLLVAVRAAYTRSHGTYGSPRIARELRAHGVVCGRHRVARVMRHAGLRAHGKRRWKTTTRARAGRPVAPNRLPAVAQVRQPNTVWVSDITYVWTAEGWLYFAGVVDVCTRRAVGWAFQARLTDALVLEALQQAFGQQQPRPGLLVHSDRGSQYTSHACAALVTAWGGQQSMSAAGRCYDNALMESFFATVKTELVYRTRYHSRAEARHSIVAYLVRFYNACRRHSALGYLAPAEFERQVASA